jgi:hypothetical protein
MLPRAPRRRRLGALLILAAAGPGCATRPGGTTPSGKPPLTRAAGPVESAGEAASDALTVEWRDGGG